MRFREPLNDILGRRSKVVLLRYLVLFRKECTGRELARDTGLDHKTCHEALRDLSRHGVVWIRWLGSAAVYSLHAEHPAVRDVLVPAFEWERTLLDRYSRDLRKLLGRDALSIILFGSVARGTEDPESDVDLLVVARDRAAVRALKLKADHAVSRLREVYGRFPQIMVTDVRTYRAEFMRGKGIFYEIGAAGRVLHGLRIEELLKHGRPTRRRKTDLPG